MMMDTAVVTTDLDRLAERVEKAASLIAELRTRQSQLEAKLTQLETEKVELTRRLEDTAGKLQGNDPTALVTEVAALKKEQREWVTERKDVATRIESLLKKLERIEG